LAPAPDLRRESAVSDDGRAVARDVIVEESRPPGSVTVVDGAMSLSRSTDLDRLLRSTPGVVIAPVAVVVVGGTV